MSGEFAGGRHRSRTVCENVLGEIQDATIASARALWLEMQAKGQRPSADVCRRLARALDTCRFGPTGVV
jgi:hypothetical protein